MSSLQSDFQKEVLESPVPVLVDFSAEWCGPCRMIEPAVQQLSQELDGIAKVVTVDVDQHSDVAARYGVMSIPALLVFKGGQEVDRIVGACEHEDTVAVFAHGGVVNAVLQDILGLTRPLEFPLEYTSVTRVLVSRNGARRAASINETGHVRDLLRV